MNNHHQPDKSALNQPAPDAVHDRTQQQRDQEDLHQSDQKYRRLFETMATGFAIHEAIRDENGQLINYRLLELNPAFEKLTGLKANEAVGKTILDLLPGHDPWWFTTFHQLLARKQTINIEQFLPQWNRWYDMTVFYYGEEQFAAYYNDITERKRHEANLAFLAEVSRDLVHLKTVEETMNALGAKIGRHFRATRCAFFEFNEAMDEQGGLAAQCKYDWHAVDEPSLVGRYSPSDFYTDEFLQTMHAGETFVVTNRETDSRADAKNLAALNIASCIVIPIVTGRESLFVLSINDMVPRNWHEDDIDLMQELTTRIWTRIERANAEEAWHESQKRFESIANLVPDLLWDSAPDGATNWYNQRWLAYTGQRFEAAIGRGWLEAIHPDDREASANRYNEAVDLGQSLRQEHRIRRYDGAYRWFVVSTSPLKDQTGKVVKMYGAATDIHESKLAGEALRQSEEQYRQLSAHLEEQVQERTQQLAMSVEELKRSNDNLQQFAYVASHDLQEPLRKIQQFGNLLQLRQGESKLDAESATYVERMQVSARRMSTLIRDLLNYARITTQRDSSTAVALNEVVTEILTDLEMLIEETQACIEVEALPVVEGDARQLGQLLQNLLSNALKFRQPGVVPRIAIRASRLAADHLPEGINPSRRAIAYHRIEVADNGIGFDEQYLDRIFQVFQRLHGKSEYSGTGIGLAICEKVVANHGGAITARSQPGQGATFIIYLLV